MQDEKNADARPFRLASMARRVHLEEPVPSAGRKSTSFTEMWSPANGRNRSAKSARHNVRILLDSESPASYPVVDASIQRNPVRSSGNSVQQGKLLAAD